MKIAFITETSHLDINAWSGTTYHIFSELSKRHIVVPLGEGMSLKAYWHHKFLNNGKPFYFHDYSPEVCRLLSDSIKDGHFDIVLTSVYTMASNLNVNIPIIYFSDIIYILCKDNYFPMTYDFEKRAIQREGDTLRKADKIIFSSEHAKRSAIDFYDLPEEKIAVIDFGANIAEPQDIAIDNFTDDKCHITFVGRDWCRKGGDKLMETYQLLKKQGFNCDLTIIGSTPNTTESYPDTTIIPFLNKNIPNDLNTYDSIMRKTHFLVLPTKYDAFGIVFCEACAYGVPSVTADIGGVSQPIKNNVNGFLLSPKAEAREYANKIRHTFEDKKAYLQLRKRARNEYEKRLNWGVWGNKVSKLMEEAIAKFGKEETDDNHMYDFYIPVYAINLKSRPDRLCNLKEQFTNRPEFAVTYIEAVKDNNGALGLWKSICKAIKLAQQQEDDVIILCEDDHEFTKSYNRETFFSNIADAYRQGAELLNCGVGGFGNAVPLSQSRAWTDWFWCTQFIVVFSSMFPKILNYEFKTNDTADGVLSHLSCHSQLLYPSVSTQKSFDYSDITAHQSQSQFQNNLFTHTNARLNTIFDVYNRYHKHK